MNDRDGLTDMTMLHYACKSGASESNKIISYHDVKPTIVAILCFML